MVQSEIKRAKRSKQSNKRAKIKRIKKALNQPQANSEELQRGKNVNNMATKDILDQPQANSEELQRGKNVKSMATKDMLEKAKKELADLTGFKSPSAIGFKKEGDDWVASIEVIEKDSIPDGMDVLGTYEVRVDRGGKIIGYERTDLRKRVDTALNKEV